MLGYASYLKNSRFLVLISAWSVLLAAAYNEILGTIRISVSSNHYFFIALNLDPRIIKFRS